MPTVTDNTGATETSGITLTWDDGSGVLAQDIAVAEATTLSYTATDFAGNSANCEIDVEIEGKCDK